MRSLLANTFRNNIVFPWVVIGGTCILVSGDLCADARDSPCDREYQPAGSGYNFLAAHKKDDQQVNDEEVRIGALRYTRLNVFDESNDQENNALYRWVNRMHTMTRERVIAQNLLIQSGDLYDKRLIEESERMLRSKKYLYDADIRSTSHCKKVIDLEVITKDVWSFSPTISFTRAGGENEYQVGLRETNLFGTGKEATILTGREENRNSHDLVYKDTNIMGSRIALRTHLADSDDGSRESAVLFLPFFALDSRRSWRFGFNNISRIDTQYFRNDEISEVQHKSRSFDTYYGFSRGLVNGIAERFTIGYQYGRHEYSDGDELPPPQDFPFDRKLSYPFIGYENIEDNYSTRVDFDQIHRVEDFHLGHRLFFRIGYSGTDESRLVSTGRAHDTLLSSQKMLLQHRIKWDGYWNFDRDEIENLTVSYALRYHRIQSKHTSFFGSFQSVYSKNLSAERQVLLGGNNGLRGYPSRYQAGDRSYLFTIEERVYTDYHLFRMVRLGWAVFFDMGRAWFPNEDNGPNSGTLMNAGFGIRLASSKSDHGSVVHFDVAVPFDKHEDVDDVQFLVTIEDSF